MAIIDTALLIRNVTDNGGRVLGVRKDPAVAKAWIEPAVGGFRG